MSTRVAALGRAHRRTAMARPVARAPRLAMPWTRPMFAVYTVLVLLGAALFLIGYRIVADEITYDAQAPGINLAIAGVVLADAAGVLLLVAGRRAVNARRVAVLGVAPAGLDRPRAAAASSSALVAGAGLTRFHRADCPLASNREWTTDDRAAHERAGRRACGVCRP